MSQYTGLWMPFPLPEMDFVVKITWSDIVDVRPKPMCGGAKHLLMGDVLFSEAMLLHDAPLTATLMQLLSRCALSLFSEACAHHAIVG